MKLYLTKINDFVERLDTDLQTALNRVSTRRQFAKGSYLLRSGDICRHSFLLVEGAARKFYLTEAGKDVTTEFYFPDDLAVSLQSYTLQEPGVEFIQALAETVVLMIDYAAVQKLKIIHPKLLELDLMLVEYYAMWLEERLFQFHSFDASERYRQLLVNQPEFVRKVNLTYIASYLGVSLETLSRIRAKI